MKITIHSALVAKIADDIQRDRPELFGAYTSAFKSEVKDPWRKNEPSEHTSSASKDVELHHRYDVTKVIAGINNSELFIRGTMNATVRRKTTVGVAEETITSDLHVSVSFKDAQAASTHYKLSYNEMRIGALKPNPLQQVVSWFTALQMTDGAGPATGIPKVLNFEELASQIRLSPPQINKDELVLEGRLL